MFVLTNLLLLPLIQVRIPFLKFILLLIYHIILVVLLLIFLLLLKPQTYQEAVLDSRWVDAMKQEIRALEENDTWEVVSLPQGKVPIGCKWVYRIKYQPDGSIERFKARLVGKCFR